jgi:hypothetical protein
VWESRKEEQSLIQMKKQVHILKAARNQTLMKFQATITRWCLATHTVSCGDLKQPHNKREMGTLM